MGMNNIAPRWDKYPGPHDSEKSGRDEISAHPSRAVTIGLMPDLTVTETSDTLSKDMGDY